MNNVETDLLARTTERLQAQGLAVVAQTERRRPGERPSARGGDALLRIGKDKRYVDYVVEVKKHVTPATLGAVVTQLREIGKRTKRTPLLFTDYITPQVADRFRAEDQQFVDVAGNTFLEGPGVLIFVTGRKPESKVAIIRPAHAFTQAGLKTLFAFICNPALVNQPYREIAGAANVALGALPAVLAALHQTGYLMVHANKRRLVATKRLLDEWALAYARTLRPKQLVRTLVARTIADWQAWDLKADGKEDVIRWGGEPAAFLLTKHLRPGTLTLYADKVPARLMAKQHLIAARPNDDQGLVEIRKPFWGQPLHEGTNLGTVATPLVYADLLATGEGRCIETAELIYEKHLARLFPKA